MATVEDMIKRAFKLVSIIGNNEDYDTADIDDAFLQVNGIIEEWNSNKMMSYSISKNSFALTPNEETYTIGSGGDFNIARPIEIINAYLTDVNGTSYPIQLMQNNDYDSIVLKGTTGSWPSYLFYNPSYPLAEITLWPKPSINYTLNLSTWSGFTPFASKTTTISLPTGYYELLLYQTAIESCSYFNMPVPPRVEKKFYNLNRNLQSFNYHLMNPTLHINTPTSGRIVTPNTTYIPKGI